MNEKQVRWDAWPHYYNKEKFSCSYFDEYYTRSSFEEWSQKWTSWHPSASQGVLMLYAQKYTVDDRPWAPGAGNVIHARRSHGYADYRPGYFYFAADEELSPRQPPRVLPRGPRPRGGTGRCARPPPPPPPRTPPWRPRRPRAVGGARAAASSRRTCCSCAGTGRSGTAGAATGASGGTPSSKGGPFSAAPFPVTCITDLPQLAECGGVTVFSTLPGQLGNAGGRWP